jgi:holo-ACP synthase CitX
MNREFTFKEILAAREERAERQESLINEYGCPIITIRVNYPGLNRCNEVTSGIMKVMSDLIKAVFKQKLKFSLSYSGAEGPIFIAGVDCEPLAIKGKTIKIEEEHPLGRFVDVDVLSCEAAISRSQFDMPPRKCYLCDEIAHICVRSRRHKESEIIEFIKQKYFEYIKREKNI